MAVARRRVARVCGREEEEEEEGLGGEPAREEEMARCISAVLGPPFCRGDGGCLVDGFLEGADSVVTFEVIVLVVVGGAKGISWGESRDWGICCERRNCDENAREGVSRRCMALALRVCRVIIRKHCGQALGEAISFRRI